MLKAGVFGKTGETCGESRTGRRNRGRRDIDTKCRVLPIGYGFLEGVKGAGIALLRPVYGQQRVICTLAPRPFAMCDGGPGPGRVGFPGGAGGF